MPVGMGGKFFKEKNKKILIEKFSCITEIV